MENPKKLKVAVIALSIVLGGALCALAWALWQNHWWRISVDELANEAGISWAMRSFRRGQLTLWESNPTNDSPRFSGLMIITMGRHRGTMLSGKNWTRTTSRCGTCTTILSALRPGRTSKRCPNEAVQRIGASRLAQVQIKHQRRLAPIADLSVRALL